MIDRISGKIVEKKPLLLKLRLGGFVLNLNIPISSHDTVGEKGEDVELFIHLYLREDEVRLYGFASEKERQVFRLLITVSQVSCKLACQMLSNLSIDNLSSAILSGNKSLLKSIPGVGDKLAARLIVELKDKFEKLSTVSIPSGTQIDDDASEDVIAALTALGYKQKESLKALAELRKSGPVPEDTGEFVKLALRILNRG